VCQIHVIVELLLIAKVPVFVVVPADGTLPVPIQLAQTYCVVPLVTGELVTAAFKVEPQL
jgi:hypothetical protein